MSDEKIDLAEIEKDARDDYVMRREETLALVRAVRAARAFDASLVVEDSVPRYVALSAALSPFTDSADSNSAEVRSDA